MDVFALLIFPLLFLLISPPWLIHAQQPYVGLAANACDIADNSTSVLGYTCNGLNTTCQAYLTFRSQPPYNTVSSISKLLNSDPSQVSQINSVSENSTIEPDKLVIVPVKCSCTGGEFYQSNTSYIVDNPYFSIANNTFEGLSTCQALQAQNGIPATTLPIGANISVPLRCACPTKNQSDDGVKYLLSYLVSWNQDVSSISTMFGVDYKNTLEANELKNKKKKHASASVITSQSFEAIKKPEGKNKVEEEESAEFLERSVYRGTIKGDFAAIKKMDGDVSQEISVLNKISHFNLICLSGVCFHDGHWYLVYEYANNGPLSGWIYHDNIDKRILSWTQRIQIALDVAMGLNYIHNYTSPPFVHKDLKTTNVLLDSELRAKIANFGLARSADGQEGEFALTRHIVGTKGYMAPEYLENGFISTKLDVYAFGVLLLEILTGKEVSALYEGVNGHLSDVLSPVIHEENGKENLGEFMDPSLQESYPAELAVLVAGVADSCIKNDPSARPGMAEIVQSLSRIMTTSLNWEKSKTVSGYHSFT
ncbi:hypothetical protein RHSIM_Rhsim02G0229200 [Rhododendron simsii]|uniref:Protein kinase domain-containing protein n=1 Tax=Rhododendron simsii TaxID=118357 RepID=A0A834LW30_RHOSS|nr:hypothetical protein RHSIM_Rhsim02G0229200 [Rhododendron simsii]